MQTNANVMPGGASIPGRCADPRVLLLCVLVVVVASMATVRTMGGMLALFAFTAVWHAAIARPAATVRVVLRILPFAALILVLNAVLVPGDPVFTVAGRRVASEQGLHDGAFFALRLGVMLTAVSALVAGSGAESLAHGIHDLVRRVSRPVAGRVAFFTFLSAGFVPLFTDEIQRVQTAQAFRGGTPQRGFVHRAGSVRTWLVPVLMSAVRRSGQLALAVELRDIRARLIPSLPALRVRVVDLAWLASALVVCALASWSRF